MKNIRVHHRRNVPSLKWHHWIVLDELCPTQMVYWAKNFVTVLSWAAHRMAYL